MTSSRSMLVSYESPSAFSALAKRMVWLFFTTIWMSLQESYKDILVDFSGEGRIIGKENGEKLEIRRPYELDETTIRGNSNVYIVFTPPMLLSAARCREPIKCYEWG